MMDFHIDLESLGVLTILAPGLCTALLDCQPQDLKAAQQPMLIARVTRYYLDTHRTRDCVGSRRRGADTGQGPLAGRLG